jgi:hypothetical protein
MLLGGELCINPLKASSKHVSLMLVQLLGFRPWILLTGSRVAVPNWNRSQRDTVDVHAREFAIWNRRLRVRLALFQAFPFHLRVLEVERLLHGRILRFEPLWISQDRKIPALSFMSNMSNRDYDEQTT